MLHLDYSVHVVSFSISKRNQRLESSEIPKNLLIE